ncbi:phytanoyl-CoA dioxygenase, peroxisomal-like isoform X1 [Anabrus simplex]|uniref:phytanoyl-CoA dioxygenase, peroxisomal-like isoform X1 n=1 Tax=Anabrus simplex TaxID=316456 RepID=UPI0035A2897E
MDSERLSVIFRHLHGNVHNWNIMPGVVAATNSFRYTLDGPMLSWDQRQFYEDNGYLIITQLIEPQLLHECRERFVDICEGRFPKGEMTLMKDISLLKLGVSGEFLYNKLQDIVWDDVLSKYILHDGLLDYVQCFTGPNIMAMHSMLINKPPDSGKMTSQHPLHQDLHYFAFRPADRIVASWTAIDRVTVDNGCLEVIPGSHKGILLRHEYPRWENGVNKAFHGVQGFDHYPRIPLEMEPGDTVFFHPLLIHGSGVNSTKGFRKAISCHYADSACEYIEVRGTSQENIANEVSALAKRRGYDMDFRAFWEFRCRLARGVRLNL